jgi:hypothetical protein
MLISTILRMEGDRFDFLEASSRNDAVFSKVCVGSISNGAVDVV